MILNEKQLAAARVLLVERLPSAEAMHADAMQTIDDISADWLASAIKHESSQVHLVKSEVRIKPPTIAEINARVTRDAVVWVKEDRGAGVCAREHARVGAWILSVDTDHYPSGDWMWSLNVAGPHGRGHAATGRGNYAIDEAKSRCIAMLQELGVTL